VEWAPRSPDLNPLDFAFWGYLKEKVCSMQIQNLKPTPFAAANYRRLRSCGSGCFDGYKETWCFVCKRVWKLAVVTLSRFCEGVISLCF
jgi:hypothetical protein